jgi:hypothetical protein
MDGVVGHIEFFGKYFVWMVLLEIMNSSSLDSLIKEIEFLFQKRKEKKRKNELKTWL